MPWKNLNGEESLYRPTRVRLPNSETRTAEEVTDEVLAEAGWFWQDKVSISQEILDSTQITEIFENTSPQDFIEISSNLSGNISL